MSDYNDGFAPKKSRESKGPLESVFFSHGRWQNLCYSPTSLWASSPGSSGGGARKRTESVQPCLWNLNSASNCPVAPRRGVTVDWAVRFPPTSAKWKRARMLTNIEKYVKARAKGRDRLFTVLYFSVRSSRSGALRYGLQSCMSVQTT